VQPDDAVQATQFDLNNRTQWKPMDHTALASVRHLEQPPLQVRPLKSPTCPCRWDNSAGVGKGR
jgi:hypothetical protein